MAVTREWHGVYEEVRRLCESLEKTPERCECGDAEAHLAAVCHCCHGHVAGTSATPGQPPCGERIAQLQADLALLCEDFKQASAPMTKGAKGDRGPEIRRALFLAADELGRIFRALEDLDRAVVGFRRTCSIVDMKRIKRESTSLLARCGEVDKILGQAGPERPDPGEE